MLVIESKLKKEGDEHQRIDWHCKFKETQQNDWGVLYRLNCWLQALRVNNRQLKYKQCLE